MTTSTTHPELGLRERKKHETRDRLRQVALRLATERGFEHVTVEDIAADADVSTRTFFNYFSSKEEALVGPDPSSASDLAQALADRPADEPPLDSLRHLMRLRAGYISDHADEIRARMKLIKSCPALQPRYFATASTFDRVIAEGIAARTGTDPDLDAYPALLAAVASTAMRTTIVTWLAGTGERPLAELLDEAFDQIAEGLPKPSKPTKKRTTR